MLSTKNILANIKQLCSPAYVYLVISTISLILLLVQNIGNTNTYCVGNYACKANTLSVFIGKVLYIAFWTFALNYICKKGYKQVAWFILLLPFISLFILLGLLILHRGVLKI